MTTEYSAKIRVAPPQNGQCPQLSCGQGNTANVSVSHVPEPKTPQQLIIADSPSETKLTFVGKGLEKMEFLPSSDFTVDNSHGAKTSEDTGTITVIDKGHRGIGVFMLKIGGKWYDPQIYNTGGGG